MYLKGEQKMPRSSVGVGQKKKKNGKNPQALWNSAASSLLCFAQLLYPLLHWRNLWGLDQPNENYIHNHNTPAYEAYIMQQMSIGGQGV